MDESVDFNMVNSFSMLKCAESKAKKKGKKKTQKSKLYACAFGHL